MTDIKTFDLVSDGYLGQRMDCVDDGEWMWTDDHLEVVKKFERELYEYKQEVAELQEQLREAGLL